MDPFPTCPPPPQGRGTNILSAMKVLSNKGVCEETFWPYEGCNPCEPNCDIGAPKEGADQNAQQYKINAYAQLDDIITMKRSLVVNGPFVIGIPVHENWWNQEVLSTGKIPMPNGSQHVGGHALCVVGYNDETQMFKFKNSWGRNWGENGYGYLPYEYMSLQWSEAWSITDLIENPRSLIEAKEEILNKLGESFIEEN
ncbi:C1 family peptidase [Bacillus cereus]|uniref:C1 family peptidase n=1 Tax=Bacillus cereus TaxID=1396 RepID=UPI00311AA9EE